MNNQKPNTPEQRAVDGIFRQDATNRAQKEIDAEVSKLEKGQSKSEAKGKNATEKFRSDTIKELAEEGIKVDTLSGDQVQDNDYYSGMSQ